MAQVKVWRSCSEPEQRNATSLDVRVVRCCRVARSIPPAHRHPPHPQRQSDCGASEGNKSTDSCFLLPSDFFHSDTSCALSAPLPLAGCRVSLLSCHTGPPTLTHEGREGETERLLHAEDRLCLWKITFSRKSCEVGRAKNRVCVPARGVSRGFTGRGHRARPTGAHEQVDRTKLCVL